MKIIEKITLVLYSCIMLILSVVLCLVIFGWLDTSLAARILYNAVTGETSSKVLLGLSVVFILLSIKCIFFSSDEDDDENEKQGVLLQNGNGKLLISKETIENLVNSVALNFPKTEDVTTRIELDGENNVVVYVNLVVSDDVVIKDLSSRLQDKIKEKIKTATDLDVKEVNIAVKKVSQVSEGQA